MGVDQRSVVVWLTLFAPAWACKAEQLSLGDERVPSVVGGAASGEGGDGGGSSADANLLGELKGFLIQSPCGDESATDHCETGGWIYRGVTHACVAQALDTDLPSTKDILDFPVAGEPGKTYVATLHFYGIIEPKVYTSGVTREAAGRPGLGNPSDPPPWATSGPALPVQAPDFNTFELHVLDDTGVERNVYFPNADSMDGTYTFALDFERSIEVYGGGRIHIRRVDTDCHQIKNCGGGTAPCANKAQTIASLATAMPEVASVLTQPGLGKSAEHAGQWIAIDVKSVVPKP